MPETGHTNAQPITIDSRLPAALRRLGRNLVSIGLVPAGFGTFILWLTGFELPFAGIGDALLWAFPIIGFALAVFGYGFIDAGLLARFLSGIGAASP